MPLITRQKMPPGGFFFREPTLNWSTPNPFLPFDMIVRQIQSLRVSNQAAGLNPAGEAIAAELEAYTCARLNGDLRWCSPPQSAVAQLMESQRKETKKCAGCGKGKKRK